MTSPPSVPVPHSPPILTGTWLNHLDRCKQCQRARIERDDSGLCVGGRVALAARDARMRGMDAQQLLAALQERRKVLLRERGSGLELAVVERGIAWCLEVIPKQRVEKAQQSSNAADRLHVT